MFSHLRVLVLKGHSVNSPTPLGTSAGGLPRELDSGWQMLTRRSPWFSRQTAKSTMNLHGLP
jgi:hypothetical protein